MQRFATVAAAIVLCVSATAAMAQTTSWVDDFKKGHSEEWIGQDAGHATVDSLKRRYGLKDGFTDSDLRAAAAITGVKRLRTDYNLGPDFTAASFANAAGNQRVNDLFKSYPSLQPHFTMRELARARAVGNLDFGFSAPFSFDEYARVEVRTELADLLKEGIPVNFTYDDLIQVQGPEKAAQTRARYGFSKQATHSEIVAAISRYRAKQFVSYHDGLKEGFTAADFLAAETEKQLDYIAKDYGLDGSATEQDYLAFRGQEELRYLLSQFNQRRAPSLLSSTFTEKEYAAAEGERAVSELRDRYDLDAGFTEQDIYNAASASAQASERQRYHLTLGFTEAEDGKARQSCVTATWFEFGPCGQMY